jgi:hypothetical protein
MFLTMAEQLVIARAGYANRSAGTKRKNRSHRTLGAER